MINPIMRTDISTERRAWITGAGKGIGRALALALAEEGWTVAISARSNDDLAQLIEEAAETQGRLVAYRLDVTDEAAVGEVVARIEEELGALDLAVLNAGTHKPMQGKSFDVGVFRSLVETNLMGTVHCLGVIMPLFLKRRAGQIAVVASVAGYRGLPTAAAYGATKAALINMCEALRPELEGAGVLIQLVSPGFVDTPLSRKNTFSMPFLISPDEAAKALVKGLGTRRFEIAFPLRMVVAMKILRALPYNLFFRITRRIAG
jgi:short-subunit dehydrogenase